MLPFPVRLLPFVRANTRPTISPSLSLSLILFLIEPTRTSEADQIINLTPAKHWLMKPSPPMSVGRSVFWSTKEREQTIALEKFEEGRLFRRLFRPKKDGRKSLPRERERESQKRSGQVISKRGIFCRCAQTSTGILVLLLLLFSYGASLLSLKKHKSDLMNLFR